MAGRNSKYNQEVHERIVKAVNLGATRAMAASAGGIGERTLGYWLAQAKDDPDSKYRKLWEDYHTAGAQAGVNALETITKAHAKGDWKAAAWLLERKFGYRRDGVRELHEHAVLPGNLEQHKNEILADTRRLRIDAAQSGSYVSAATLLRMEDEIVEKRRAAEKAQEEATHANANTNDLLEVISNTVDGMPRSMLDRLASIIEDKRRRAS